MDLEIKEKTRIAPEDVGKHYRTEIERVTQALEDAKKQMMDLRQAKVLTGEKANKITELNYAIAIGKMYLTKLKSKI
jgi:hypothetical protein